LGVVGVLAVCDELDAGAACVAVPMVENPDGEYAGLGDDAAGALGRGSGSPVVGQVIAGSDDHRLELADHRLELDHGLESLELGHSLSSYDDAGESEAEELGAAELGAAELAEGEPKDEVKEPDGDEEEPDGDELGEEADGVKELVEDVKELAGFTGLSFMAGLSPITSGASAVRVLASVDEDGASGRSLMMSARRAFTVSASVASGRLTLVPLP
jgi:hypothetical protein